MNRYPEMNLRNVAAYPPETVAHEVFHRLLDQGACSMMGRGPGCAYRGVGGNKCAVGLLMDDADYHPGMEGAGVRSLRENRGLTFLPRGAKGDNLWYLQRIHDRAACHSADDFSTRLLDAAASIGGAFAPVFRYADILRTVLAERASEVPA